MTVTAVVLRSGVKYKRATVSVVDNVVLHCVNILVFHYPEPQVNFAHN